MVHPCRLVALSALASGLLAGARPAAPPPPPPSLGDPAAAVAPSDAAVARVLPMPEAIASFGAAAAGDSVYVFGGHTGRVHDHSHENLTGRLLRLRVEGDGTWEDLPAGPPLQGTALVAHGRHLYRVGGLSARNASDEPEDLHSVASCARFDLETGSWEELPPLPEPRSSHDVAVIGDELFVVGGWSLQGEETHWAAKSFRAKLGAKEFAWTAIEQPFQRRGLAACAWNGAVYALGGMDEHGEPTNAVSVLDPVASTWTEGPSLPATGFGIAAVSGPAGLLASTRDGRLQRLDAGAGTWAPVADLLWARIFHRVVALPSGELVALGGAVGRRHVAAAEILPAGWGTSSARVWHAELAFPGDARQRSAIAVQGDRLLLFGGNRRVEAHKFTAEDFTDQAWSLDLLDLGFASLPSLPVPRQSMGIVEADGQVLLVGGFGRVEGVLGAQSGAFRLDPARTAWTSSADALPAPLTQFGLATCGGKSWILGGLPYREGAGLPPPRDEVFVADASMPAGATRASATRLRAPRRAFGCAALADRIYLVGGMADGFQPVEECEALDTRSEEALPITAPSTARVSPELVASGERLYLLGGSSKGASGSLAPETSVEQYDPERDRWSVVCEELPFAPLHLCATAWRDSVLALSLAAEPGRMHLAWIRPAAPTE